MSAVAELDPRLSIGGNHPPKDLTPFEQSRDEIDGLFEEAGHWLDGSGVNSPEEEDGVEKLLDALRKAKKAADTCRKIENEPFDKGKAEVQARYNPILSKADMAADVCKKALAPYRQRIADEKAAIAEEARKAADEKRRAAEVALRSSQVADLAGRAEAEALLADAKKAERTASKADKAATTGTGLRTTYRTELTDASAAARHYWAARRLHMESFLLQLAKSDVSTGSRSIPGFTITEEKVAI